MRARELADLVALAEVAQADRARLPLALVVLIRGLVEDGGAARSPKGLLLVRRDGDLVDLGLLKSCIVAASAKRSESSRVSFTGAITLALYVIVSPPAEHPSCLFPSFRRPPSDSAEDREEHQPRDYHRGNYEVYSSAHVVLIAGISGCKDEIVAVEGVERERVDQLAVVRSLEPPAVQHEILAHDLGRMLEADGDGAPIVELVPLRAGELRLEEVIVDHRNDLPAGDEGTVASELVEVAVVEVEAVVDALVII